MKITKTLKVNKKLLLKENFLFFFLFLKNKTIYIKYIMFAYEDSPLFHTYLKTVLFVNFFTQFG